MESSILSEVDDTSILRTGLPTPLCLSSQLATGLSPLAPSSGLERSDFVPCAESGSTVLPQNISAGGLPAALRPWTLDFPMPRSIETVSARGSRAFIGYMPSSRSVGAPERQCAPRRPHLTTQSTAVRPH